MNVGFEFANDAAIQLYVDSIPDGDLRNALFSSLQEYARLKEENIVLRNSMKSNSDAPQKEVSIRKGLARRISGGQKNKWSVDSSKENSPTVQRNLSALEKKKIISDLVAKLTEACWNGILEDVLVLMKRVENNINDFNDKGQTALYCACRQGHYEVVKLLLKNKKIQVNLKMPSHGGTALHAAAYQGHGAITAILLYSDALFNIENDLGLTSRLESKGEASEVFIYFETGKGSLAITQLCEKIKAEISASMNRFQTDIERVIKVSLLGSPEFMKPTKRLFSEYTHQDSENIQHIICNKTLMNVWSYPLDASTNTSFHKMALTGTGLQIISIGGENGFSIEDAICPYLTISKITNMCSIPTLVIVYDYKNITEKIKSYVSKFNRYIEFIFWEDKLTTKDEMKKTQFFSTLERMFDSAKNIFYIQNYQLFSKQFRDFSLFKTKSKISSVSEVSKLFFGNQLIGCGGGSSSSASTPANTPRETILQQQSSQLHPQKQEEQELQQPPQQMLDSIESLANAGFFQNNSENLISDVVVLDLNIFYKILENLKISSQVDSGFIDMNGLKLFLSELGNETQEVEMIIRALSFYEFIFEFRGKNEFFKHLRKSTKKFSSNLPVYWVPSLLVTLNQTKLLKINHSKRESKFTRNFSLGKYSISLFEKILFSIFSIFGYSYSSWVSPSEKKVLFQLENGEILIKLDDHDTKKSYLSVEYAGKHSELNTFSKVILAIRHVFDCYFSEKIVSEWVDCLCLTHSFQISELVTNLTKQDSITCSQTQKPVNLSSLAPELYMPHMKHIESPKGSVLLGEGAFGLVYKATLSDGKLVAMKSLKKTKDLASEDLFAKFKEFQMEVFISTLFDNPYLLKTFGVVKDMFAHQILEYMPGGVLGDLLYSQNPVPIADKVKAKILLDVSHGLEALHSFKPPIIHRDLRSFNIFINSLDFDSDPFMVNAKIGDFGLSICSTVLNSQTLSTWQWLAPEVFTGGKYDEKSDIYSFGMVAYEVFARIMPFTDMSQFIQTIQRTLTPQELEDPYTIKKVLDSGYTITGNKATIEQFDVMRIRHKIEKGLRPNIPSSWGIIIKGFLTSCWKVNKNERPVTSDLVEFFLELVNAYTPENNQDYTNLLHSLRKSPNENNNLNSNEDTNNTLNLASQRELEIPVQRMNHLLSEARRETIKNKTLTLRKHKQEVTFDLEEFSHRDNKPVNNKLENKSSHSSNSKIKMSDASADETTPKKNKNVVSNIYDSVCDLRRLLGNDNFLNGYIDNSNEEGKDYEKLHPESLSTFDANGLLDALEKVSSSGLERKRSQSKSGKQFQVSHNIDVPIPKIGDTTEDTPRKSLSDDGRSTIVRSLANSGSETDSTFGSPRIRRKKSLPRERKIESRSDSKLTASSRTTSRNRLDSRLYYSDTVIDSASSECRSPSPNGRSPSPSGRSSPNGRSSPLKLQVKDAKIDTDSCSSDSGSPNGNRGYFYLASSEGSTEQTGNGLDQNPDQVNHPMLVRSKSRKGNYSNVSTLFDESKSHM